MAQDETDVAARLAEVLLAADADERRPDGVRVDVAHRYAAALLPVVRELQAEAEQRGFRSGFDSCKALMLAPVVFRADPESPDAATLRGEAGR